jgi:hypothetical protein
MHGQEYPRGSTTRVCHSYVRFSVNDHTQELTKIYGARRSSASTPISNGRGLPTRSTIRLGGVQRFVLYSYGIGTFGAAILLAPSRPLAWLPVPSYHLSRRTLGEGADPVPRPGYAFGEFYSRFPRQCLPRPFDVQDVHRYV